MQRVSDSAELPEGLRGCVSGFTKLRDREKRRVSDSAELPEGQTWRSTRCAIESQGKTRRETGYAKARRGKSIFAKQSQLN